MSHTHIAIASVALLTIGASLASASTITFTESAVASGVLGSTSFTNSLITLTATGDTSTVTESPPGFFRSNVPDISIDIASVGIATIMGGQVFSCGDNLCLSTPPLPHAAGGFSPNPSVGRDILDTVDEAFNTYHLTTSIGPITDSSLINASFPFNTDRGVFEISSAGNATFTARAAATVPEPGSIALLGFALMGLAVLKSRYSASVSVHSPK